MGNGLKWRSGLFGSGAAVGLLDTFWGREPNGNAVTTSPANGERVSAEEYRSVEELLAAVRAEQDGGDLDVDRLPVVFACLLKIISRCQALPVRVVSKSTGEVLPTPEWVKRPSSLWSWRDLVSQSAYSLLLYGGLWLWPEIRRGAVTSMLCVDPSRAKWNEVTGVRRLLPKVVPVLDGLPIPAMRYCRYLTAPGGVYGFAGGPWSKKAREMSASSEKALINHFRKGARIEVVFSAKDVMTPEALQEATRRVRAHYSGVANWWEPAVIGSGLQVHTLSQGAEQGQYLTLSQWSDARVASMRFGVDPTLLGINLPGSQLTYSNAVDRESNLWRDAIRPVVGGLEEAFGAFLPDGQRFDFVEAGLLAGGPRDRVAYGKELAGVNRTLGVWLFSADEIRDSVGFPALDGPLELLPPPNPTEETPEPKGGDDGAENSR